MLKTCLAGGLFGLLLAAQQSLAVTHVKAPTEHGVFVGEQKAGALQFLGIPYAQQPIGERRWRKPLPPRAHEGERAVIEFGPACPQGKDNFSGTEIGPHNEACLYLNIWAPTGYDAPLPVMVWLHGGAHRMGAGSLPLYNGASLAQRGVVVVTLNYRLGYLGYFAHPALSEEGESGNFGLLDQVRALEWIQRNIAAFGGDPDRVTVFGESAGAVDIQYLMTNPAAQGLFQAAIIQSGGGWAKPAAAYELQEQVLENLASQGISENADAKTLRELSPETLVEALSGRTRLGFGPFIDGELVTRAPWEVFAEGRQHEVPVLIGSNSWEGNLGRLQPPGFFTRLMLRLPPMRGLYAERGDSAQLRYEMAFGDIGFGAPARWVATQHQRHAPTYLYYFDYVREARRSEVPGAGHGAEIVYAFDSIDYSPSNRGAWSSHDKEVSAAMADCWAAFAKKGKPTCAFLDWKPFDAGQPMVMVIDNDPRLTEGHPLANTFDKLEKWFGPGALFGP